VWANTRTTFFEFRAFWGFTSPRVQWAIQMQAFYGGLLGGAAA